MSDLNKGNLLSSKKDSIDTALEEASKKVKKERTEKIGALLDKATVVLTGALDEAGHKMRAAELAVALYTSQSAAERADRQLELQSKRLEIEEKKMGINTLLVQQNNIYDSKEGSPKHLVTTEEGSVVDVDLLARKKAMQMLLDSTLGGTSKDFEEDYQEGDQNEN